MSTGITVAGYGLHRRQPIWIIVLQTGFSTVVTVGLVKLVLVETGALCLA